MSITGINGKIRCGKGVWLAALTLDMADSGKYKEVLTNYPLKHPLARQITLYEFLCLLKRPIDFTRLLLSTQEVWAWLNSHRSMSNVSEIEDAIVFQSGKMGFDWNYDTQVQMRTLGSLRDMTSQRWLAEKFGDTKVDFETGYFQYTPLDTRFKDNVPLADASSVRIPFTVASLWWDRFDTYERTMPFGYDNMVCEMAKAEPVVMNSEIDRQVEVLSKNMELVGSKINRLSVEDALLQLGEPTAFASFVAHRLVLGLGRNRGGNGVSFPSNGVPREILPQSRTPQAETRLPLQGRRRLLRYYR